MGAVREGFIKEPLFKGANDALRFAFEFSAEQYAPSAVAKMMQGKGIGQGLGLAGLDGAAQAGMIFAELERLNPLEKAICTARAARPEEPCNCGHRCCNGTRPTEPWENAVKLLTEYTAHVVPMTLSHFQLRYAIVAKYFGKKMDLIDIADRCRLKKNDVAKPNAEIRRHLKEGESRAWRLLEDALLSAGITGRR